MDNTNYAIIEIVDTPFDYDMGDYLENDEYSYYVKVTDIPDEYDKRQLIVEYKKGLYSPVLSYVADKSDISCEFNWKDDDIECFIRENEFDDDEIDGIYNFIDVINYFNNL